MKIKFLCGLFVIVFFTGCGTGKKKDMSLFVKGYKNETVKSIEKYSLAYRGGVDSTKDTISKSKVKPYSLWIVSTVLGDIFLTLDFINDGYAKKENVKSLKILISYLNKFVKDDIKDETKLAQLFALLNKKVNSKSVDHRGIRKLLEKSFLDKYIRKQTKLIKCDNCYTFKDVLAHIALCYNMYAKDYFKYKGRFTNKILNHSIAMLAKKGEKRIAEQLKQLPDKKSSDYLKRQKEFIEYVKSFKRPYQHGKTRVEHRGSKIQIRQRINDKVEQIYEVDKGGIRFRLRWR